jgi:predicted esterase
MCNLKKFVIPLLVIVLLVMVSLACGRSDSASPTISVPPEQKQPFEQPDDAQATPTPEPTNLPEPTSTPEENIPEPTNSPEPSSTPEENVPEPTLATCRAWTQANHSLEYSKHGCAKHADILESVESMGGSVIPVGANRFFIVRFPDNWDQLANRKMVVTLHGSGGCAEPLFDNWVKMSGRRKYAVAALQYGEETAAGDLNYDDGAQIYKNLRVMLDELQTHCPLRDTPVVLHGFSRGSARTFEIAMMDRAADGGKVFSAFISDSGTGFAETEGKIPLFLQNAAADAYSGAHFWLYCGGKDHEGRTCEGMERMKPIILDHGGTVDALYKYPPGGHGILPTGRPEKPGEALTALFDYIDAIGDR